MHLCMPAAPCGTSELSLTIAWDELPQIVTGDGQEKRVYKGEDHGNSVLSDQFFHKPKTAIKENSLLTLKKKCVEKNMCGGRIWF
jgi:hypothetical protein